MDKPDATPKSHTHWDRKNALIGLVVCIVLVGAGIAWYLLKPEPAPPLSKEAPSSVIRRALSTQSGATRFQLEEALKNNPTKEEKQQLFQILANDSLKREDFNGAVSYLKQAYDAGLKTANIAQGIGSMYLDKLNNKPEALKYFKIGKELADKNEVGDPFAGKLGKFLDEKVKELEAQGVKVAQ